MEQNGMKPNEMGAWLASKGGWGEVGSDQLSPRYAKPFPRMRRRCWQGDNCPNRSTHCGMANGMALMDGCEFHVTRWVRDGFA